MKILYLITKSEAGGAQTYVWQLSQFFFGRGHQIAVSAKPGGWLEDKLRGSGVVFFPNNYFSNFLNPLSCWHAWRRVRQVINENKPDLICYNSSVAAAIGRLAVRRCVRSVYTAHGWGFNLGVPWWQKMLSILMEKALAGYADKIICVSEFERNLAIKYKIADKDKFVIIHNGVEFPVIHNQTCDSNNIVEIVFVGRLAKQKDPLLLLHAFSGISLDIRKRTKLIIVGDGKKRVVLDNFICKNKLGDNVEIRGYLPRREVYKILLSSDLFVLPTKWEGFPYTILEAMSCGLPVIASDVGGIREAVSDDVGVLVKKGDVDGWKKALEKLIVDDNLRQRMGEVARQRVQEKFSLRKMCEDTEKVYDEVMKR